MFIPFAKRFWANPFCQEVWWNFVQPLLPTGLGNPWEKCNPFCQEVWLICAILLLKSSPFCQEVICSMKLFAIPFVKRYSPGVIAFLSQLHCFIFCQVILLQPVFDVLQNSKYCTWFLCLVSTIKWRGGLPSSAVVPQIYALHGSFWDLVTWSLVQTFLGKAAGEAPAWVVTGPFFKGFFWHLLFWQA